MELFYTYLDFITYFVANNYLLSAFLFCIFLIIYNSFSLPGNLFFFLSSGFFFNLYTGFLINILSIVIGIFFITMFNPITSTFVKKYEIIKGSYERDQDYLAAITVNGIWIKEKRLGVNNIIKSTKLEKNNLLEVSIYQFDNSDNFVLSFDVSRLPGNLHSKIKQLYLRITLPHPISDKFTQ